MEEAPRVFGDSQPSVEEATEWVIDMIREHAGDKIPSDVMEMLRDELRSFEELGQVGEWLEENMNHLEEYTQGGHDGEDWYYDLYMTL